jgi:hypothetical protein
MRFSTQSSFRSTYVKNKWKNLGLVVAAEGELSSGKGSKPSICDTANPVTDGYGNADVGAPNERSSPSGPCVGNGCEPDPDQRGKEGENCEPLGNVLIFQEDNNRSDILNDNGIDGGTIT